MLSSLKVLWLKHGQKTIATVLGSAALVDLTGYRDSITALIGDRGYAGVRLLGAIGIVWRAAQATRTTEVIVSHAASNALDAAGVPPAQANAAMTVTGTKPVPPNDPA
jgi:hypothetical protein